MIPVPGGFASILTKKSIEAQTRYRLAKNLGWVRLEQKWEKESQEWLKVAILKGGCANGIAKSTKGVKVAVNPGMVYYEHHTIQGEVWILTL